MSEVKASAATAFASQLKAWRNHLGLNQAQFADKVGYSASLVSGVETLDKAPSADFARQCDKATGAPGTFATLQELAAREPWPSYFEPVIDLEARAVRLHEWELRVVPGLLQTEDYARSVISAGRPHEDLKIIDRAVSSRMERQRLLSVEHSPALWSVIHEGALRHVVGSPAVMSEQLARLVELASMPRVTIQVLPFSANDHPGTDGPISVFEFPDAPSVAYTECNGGGRIVEASDEVAALMTTISMIRAAALPLRQSVALIESIRRDTNDR